MEEKRRWEKIQGVEERIQVCIRKKQEENLKWEKQIEEAKQEGQIWEIVNKERKRRKEVNREIGMEEWEEHFRGLLGGVEGRVLMGEERLGRTMEERDIEKEEIWNVMRKVKDKKTMERRDTERGIEIWRGRGEGMGMEDLQQGVERGRTA